MTPSMSQPVKRETLIFWLYPVCAGICIFLSFQRYRFWPAIFLLPFFLNGMRSLPLKKKLFSYWIMAVVTNLGGFGWIRSVGVDFGGLSLPLAWGLVILFSLFNNLNFVAWAYLERVFGEKLNPVATAALFCVAEQMNPQVFPWYLGTALDSLLIFYQTADIWGVFGLSFVIVALIHLPWWLWENWKDLWPKKRGALLGHCVFVFFLLGYGNWALNHYDNTARSDRKSVGISLVQSNTAMEKFYGASLSPADRLEEFLNLVAFSRDAVAKHSGKVDLLVWPEGAVHFPILNSHRIFDPISELAREANVSIAAGSVELDKSGGERKIYNTQFVLNPKGEVEGKYRKIQLLAFGEYIPLLDTMPFLQSLLPQTISHFTPGTRKPLFRLREDVRWLPLICYEDIIFGFIAGFDHEKADFIVNTTNDGWFGRTDASYLHMQMARPRSVEFRKPMVRALNTGSSQIIDSAGRIISKETTLYTRDAINVTLNLPRTPPHTIYAIVGNIPAYLLILVVVCLWLKKEILARR